RFRAKKGEYSRPWYVQAGAKKNVSLTITSASPSHRSHQSARQLHHKVARFEFKRNLKKNALFSPFSFFANHKFQWIEETCYPGRVFGEPSPVRGRLMRSIDISSIGPYTGLASPAR